MQKVRDSPLGAEPFPTIWGGQSPAGRHLSNPRPSSDQSRMTRPGLNHYFYGAWIGNLNN